MLITVEDVLLIPGKTNTARLPTAWLNQLIGGANVAVREYCKRDLEYDNYLDYYSGNNQPDIIIRQYPVWSAVTTLATASVGAVLPQGTIFLTSVTGFPPGTGGNPNMNPPTVALQTGVSTWTTVTYTGLQASPPALTGCVGGTGTLYLPPQTPSPIFPNGANVFTPVVFYDQVGYGGQNPGGFAAGTIMLAGTQFMVEVDRTVRGASKSYRGLIRKIGGASGQAGWPWFQPEALYGGKLAAQRFPGWPRGNRNIKVFYAAGFDPRPGTPASIPFDLKGAVVMLVNELARKVALGSNVNSESLGAYSYSLLVNGDNPELGDVRRTLARYRESSWGSN